MLLIIIFKSLTLSPFSNLNFITYIIGVIKLFVNILLLVFMRLMVRLGL